MFMLRPPFLYQRLFFNLFWFLFLKTVQTNFKFWQNLCSLFVFGKCTLSHGSLQRRPLPYKRIYARQSILSDWAHGDHFPISLSKPDLLRGQCFTQENMCWCPEPAQNCKANVFFTPKYTPKLLIIVVSNEDEICVFKFLPQIVYNIDQWSEIVSWWMVSSHSDLEFGINDDRYGHIV